MKLEFEHFATQGQVRHQIQRCEGKHKQQIVYSSYHDALTQICYGCKKIRSNCNFEEENVIVVNCEINSQQVSGQEGTVDGNACLIPPLDTISALNELDIMDKDNSDLKPKGI